ncbi:hypothetical protein FJ251_05030 [bacterium]|nr:hypothetical protein [bacterium]
MRQALTLCFVPLLLWAMAAPAAIPQTISYQGILRTAGGTIVVDGNYNLTFRLYSVPAGGAALWTETQTLAVADGVFNASLGSVSALALDFSNPYWLGVAVGGAAELTPRIALAAGPYSLNADRLDGLSSEGFAASTHMHSLDALSDVGVAGAISGQVLTFNEPTFNEGAGEWQAMTPAAGNDGDWTIEGDNIYRYSGKVGIGTAPYKKVLPAGRADDRQSRDAYHSKLQVHASTPAQEGGAYVEFIDSDNASDARAAIFGTRSSGLANPGSGYAIYQTNNAITGWNSWGDNYSFGVAGYTYFDTPYTGGVLGCNQSSSVWGALGYQDASYTGWGLYTPSRGYLAGPVGIGTTAPARALEVDNPAGSAILGKVTFVGMQDYVGVEGYSVPAPFYGIGGRFEGGHHGVEGLVFPTGTGSFYGVQGIANGGTGGYNFGVYGYANGAGMNIGVYGEAYSGTSQYAGYFNGNVYVAGTLYKSAGSFKIDHPLDPANRTLSHSFVESPDMMNVYNGNLVLGPDGSAWVEMPDWFEALNRDFRYQLTAIGAPGPNLYVAEKMTDSRFKVAGGAAGLEVSWQVTGIRQDAYANAHRKDRGLYLNAEAFGLPENMSVDYQHRKNLDVRRATGEGGH